MNHPLLLILLMSQVVSVNSSGPAALEPQDGGPSVGFGGWFSSLTKEDTVDAVLADRGQPYRQVEEMPRILLDILSGEKSTATDSKVRARTNMILPDDNELSIKFDFTNPKEKRPLVHVVEEYNVGSGEVTITPKHGVPEVVRFRNLLLTIITGSNNEELVSYKLKIRTNQGFRVLYRSADGGISEPCVAPPTFDEAHLEQIARDHPATPLAITPRRFNPKIVRTAIVEEPLGIPGCPEDPSKCQPFELHQPASLLAHLDPQHRPDTCLRKNIAPTYEVNGDERVNSIHTWYEVAQIGVSPMTPEIMDACLELFERKVSALLQSRIDDRAIMMITNFYIMCIQGTEHATTDNGRRIKIKILDVLHKIHSPDQPLSVWLLAQKLSRDFNEMVDELSIAYLNKPYDPANHVEMGPWPAPIASSGHPDEQLRRKIARRIMLSTPSSWPEPSVDKAIEYVSDMLQLTICLMKERLITADAWRDRTEYPELVRLMNTDDEDPDKLAARLVAFSRWEGSYMWIMREDNILKNMENAHRWFSSGTQGISKVNNEAFNTILNSIRSRQPTIPVPVAENEDIRLLAHARPVTER